MKRIPFNIKDIFNPFTDAQNIKDYIDSRTSQSGITEQRANQLIDSKINEFKKQTIATTTNISNNFVTNTGITVSKEASLKTGKMYWTGSKQFTRYGNRLLRINIDGLKYMNLVNNKRSDGTTNGVYIGYLKGYVGNGHMANDRYTELYVKFEGTIGTNGISRFYLREIYAPSSSNTRSVNFDYLCAYTPNS